MSQKVDVTLYLSVRCHRGAGPGCPVEERRHVAPLGRRGLKILLRLRQVVLRVGQFPSRAGQIRLGLLLHATASASCARLETWKVRPQ